MTLTEFLLARIEEDEATARGNGAEAMIGWRWKHLTEAEYNWEQKAHLDAAKRLQAEAETKRKIIEWHANWPILAQTQSTFEPVDGTDPGHYTYRASQQIAWLTEQQYRDRFGDDPPSGPILRMLALPYAAHPDHDEEWRP